MGYSAQEMLSYHQKVAGEQATQGGELDQFIAERRKPPVDAVSGAAPKVEPEGGSTIKKVGKWFNEESWMMKAGRWLQPRLQYGKINTLKEGGGFDFSAAEEDERQTEVETFWKEYEVSKD